MSASTPTTEFVKVQADLWSFHLLQEEQMATTFSMEKRSVVFDSIDLPGGVDAKVKANRPLP